MSLSRVIPVAFPGASGTVGPTVDCSFYGITVAETSGSAVAQVRIRDGGVITGNILATIKLAAGASSTIHFAVGVIAKGGMFFEKVTGAVEGSVFVA